MSELLKFVGLGTGPDDEDDQYTVSIPKADVDRQLPQFRYRGNDGIKLEAKDKNGKSYSVNITKGMYDKLTKEQEGHFRQMREETTREEDPGLPEQPVIQNPSSIEPRNNAIRPINSYNPRELTGFKPGTQMYSSQRTELTPAQKSSLPSNPKSPFTIIKPLKPNILDQHALDRVKELAAQRKATKQKWTVVRQR
jgi:hypothetical protein